MGLALQKPNRLNIPARDKSKIAAPKAAMSEQGNHGNQVNNAFDFGFTRHEKAMGKLASN
ncbi:TPA: hypothetical protein ACS7XC_003666 [Providencia alcalifaciens]|uniref:hypothetical protein n=1 Tax=Providencia alcalifaciens TaxID=126385 RepID=UPI0015D0A9B1|nr:hypothetical protein [Providencia alcalifaciens]MBF0693385.1 hypothetical protein [Providencia alcalifaciens]NYS91889.1 hypothetical protein [Providencia alcalifaciens]